MNTAKELFTYRKQNNCYLVGNFAFFFSEQIAGHGS